jgi:hypothetical protein
MSPAKYRTALGICCIAGSVLQSSALAQISDGFSSPGDPVSLMVYKPVQDELELTEHQKKAAAELNQEFRDALKSAYAQALQADELLKASKQSIERANAKGIELLLPKQRNRLKQISLQVREDTVRFSLTDVTLFDVELRDTLGVSDEQASKLREASMTNEMARNGIRQQMKKLRFRSKRAQQDYIYAKVGETALKRLIDVLTPQQQATLDQLRGPDFDYPRDDLPI